MTATLAHVSKVGPAFNLKTEPEIYLGEYAPGVRVTWRRTLTATGVVVGVVFAMFPEKRDVRVETDAIDYIVVRWDHDAKLEIVDPEQVMLTADIPACERCGTHAVDTDGEYCECGHDHNERTARYLEPSLTAYERQF